MWYNISKNKRLTEAQIRKHLYPATLPKPLKPEHIEGFGIVWAEADPRPGITNLQVLVPGVFEKRAESWFQTWNIENKFQTPEQEQEYLDMLAAQATEEQRIEEYKSDQEASGIKGVTIQQAKDYIDANVADAGTANVLKKLVSFIL